MNVPSEVTQPKGLASILVLFSLVLTGVSLAATVSTPSGANLSVPLTGDDTGDDVNVVGTRGVPLWPADGDWTWILDDGQNFLGDNEHIDIRNVYFYVDALHVHFRIETHREWIPTLHDGTTVGVVLDDPTLTDQLFEIALSSGRNGDPTDFAKGYSWNVPLGEWQIAMDEEAAHIRINPGSFKGVDLAINREFMDDAYPSFNTALEDPYNPVLFRVFTTDGGFNKFEPNGGESQDWHDQNPPGNWVDDETSLTEIPSCRIPIIEIDAGDEVTILAGDTFISPGSYSGNAPEILSATVDYDDGNGPQPLTTDIDQTFTLSHTYTEPGSYTIDVVINVECGSATGSITVNVEPITTTSCFVLDFEDHPAGTIIDTEYYDSHGITISADNAKSGHPDEAILFDSANPTGGDNDLGTPNGDFSGPGVGSGGESGMPGQNDMALGNLLIIAEDVRDDDDNGLVDDPDDERCGGSVIFIFENPVVINSLNVIDIEETRGSVKTYDSTGDLIASHSIDPRGDNSLNTLQIGDDGVVRMVIRLKGSGAIDNIDYCITTGGEPESWDKSSIEVTGKCVDCEAEFTITNTGEPGEGDMDGPSEYRIYRNGVLLDTQNFQLQGGESLTITVESNGDEIKLEADQRPGHPGNSHPNAVVECRGRHGGDDDDGTTDNDDGSGSTGSGGGSGGDEVGDPEEGEPEDGEDTLEVTYKASQKFRGRYLKLRIQKGLPRLGASDDVETDTFILTVEGAKNKLSFRTIVEKDRSNKWQKVTLEEGGTAVNAHGYQVEITKIDGDTYTIELTNVDSERPLKAIHFLFSKGAEVVDPDDMDLLGVTRTS